MKTHITVFHVLRMYSDINSEELSDFVVLKGTKTFDLFPVNLNVNDTYRTTKNQYTVNEVELWDKHGYFERLVFCKPIIEDVYNDTDFIKLKEKTKVSMAVFDFSVEENEHKETLIACVNAAVKK